MNLATLSRVIDAPIGEVWAITSAFGAIRAWMPGIDKVSVEGAGIGARRTVATRGTVAVETLIELDGEKHRVRYTIAAPGMDRIRNLVGGTDLVALDDRSTRITWVAEVDSAEGDPAPIAAYLGGFIAESLAGLGAFMQVPMREA